jgi:hypothetical protein
LIRPTRFLVVWPQLALKKIDQEWLTKSRGRKSLQPLKKLRRFATAAEVHKINIEKACSLDPCQATPREEGYLCNLRPPSAEDSLAAALQAAMDLRREVMGISEADIGELSPTKHTQHRTTAIKSVLSTQDAPAWRIDSDSEYDVVGPEDLTETTKADRVFLLDRPMPLVTGNGATTAGRELTSTHSIRIIHESLHSP